MVAYHGWYRWAQRPVLHQRQTRQRRGCTLRTNTSRSRSSAVHRRGFRLRGRSPAQSAARKTGRCPHLGERTQRTFSGNCCRQGTHPRPAAAGRTPTEQVRCARAAWLLDGSWTEAKTGRQLTTAVGTPVFERGHPEDDQREVLKLDGTNCLELRGQPAEFYSFGSALTLRAWVNPDPVPLSVNPLDPRERERQTITLISNYRETSFAFGLRWAAPGYRPWLTINGVNFESSQILLPREWSHVQVSYSGQDVIFQIAYADGRKATGDSRPASLGAIGTNAQRFLRIGAEVNADPLQLQMPCRGKLADVEIWSRVPDDVNDPADPMPESVAELFLPADYIAHGMPDGAYQFWVQGIDLFGRVSAPECTEGRRAEKPDKTARARRRQGNVYCA